MNPFSQHKKRPLRVYYWRLEINYRNDTNATHPLLNATLRQLLQQEQANATAVFREFR